MGASLLLAFMVSVYTAPVLTGVPAIVAVPLPLSVKRSPEGSVPVSLRAGAGKPVRRHFEMEGVARFGRGRVWLVMAGGRSTVSVKACACHCRGDAIVGRRRQRVRTPGPGGWSPLQGSCPVAVVYEADTSGERTRFAKRWQRGSRRQSTVKLPCVPTVNVVPAALVKKGAQLWVFGHHSVALLLPPATTPLSLTP